VVCTVLAIVIKRSVAIAAASVAVAAVSMSSAYLMRLPDIFYFAITIAFLSFWIYTWLLDARFTAAHWRYVMMGQESNPLVNAIARYVARGRAWPTLILHAAFIVTAASMMAVAVSAAVQPVDTAVPFVAVLASAFLFMAGMAHVDAFLNSNEFVMRISQ
jgi:hypothetical protein